MVTYKGTDKTNNTYQNIYLKMSEKHITDPKGTFKGTEKTHKIS